MNIGMPFDTSDGTIFSIFFPFFFFSHYHNYHYFIFPYACRRPLLVVRKPLTKAEKKYFTPNSVALRKTESNPLREVLTLLVLSSVYYLVLILSIYTSF